MSATVYTCILNGYDNLRAPLVPTGARHVCYSDEPQQRPPWEVQPAYRGFGDSRDSRIPKILSHLHVDTEYSIWHDGCFTLQCDAQELINDWLADADIALFRHPGRPDIYAEAAYCARDAGSLGFDADLMAAIDAQVERYRGEGFPGAPFFAGGIIARHENGAVRAFNELWWREYRSGGRRDQFALAYAVWKSGIRVQIIEGVSPLTCPWFRFTFHASLAHAGLNPQFADEREARCKRMTALKELCQ